MTSDIDIWRAANILSKRHGRDAAIVAAQRADELLAAGDVEGQIVWKRITRAISEWDQIGPSDEGNGDN